MQQKLTFLQQVDPFCGKYFSKASIQRDVLHQDDQTVEQIAKEIKEEGLEANPITPGMPTVDAEGNPVDQLGMDQQQQDMDSANLDQSQQQSDDMHQQKLNQNDELHQEKLKKAKTK